MTSSSRPVVAMVVIGAAFCTLAILAVWFVIAQPPPARGFTGQIAIENLHFQGDGCSASIKLPDGLEEIVNIGHRDYCTQLTRGSVINVKAGRYIPEAVGNR